ncbi:helicase-related protein [Eionea flava]
MNTPQVGQRWMVDTDSSLGLGIVTDCDARSLTIDFPAIEDSRCYSRNNAPLTRVIFAVGDTIETIDDQRYVVAQVEQVNDLVIYLSVDGEPIPETRLASTVQLNHPVKRLLAGQLDKPKWFDLRADLARGHHQWLRSDVIGLQGARISLTPHQLYVADTATRLSATRILLADEVGLGKTIEAGLILQRLMLQERVQRVLIIVPDALRVQWFVELVRCFNIHAVMWGDHVDLADAQVFIAAHTILDTVDNAQNPSEYAMGVDDIVGAESVANDHFLTADDDDIADSVEDEKGNSPLTDLPWDLVIVDEAHHFDLLSDKPASRALHKIGSACEHLLLLSATPERMGLEQHFSRLQLLDASRFHDFSAFQQQYAHYEALADDIAELLDDSLSQVELSSTLQHKLQQLFPHLPDRYFVEYLQSNDPKNTRALTDLLLDCHGTGRVVFRNTRHAIQGFPERRLVTHRLSAEDSSDVDADLSWLAQFIKQHSDDKILFITHDKDDVLDIREWLYRKTGIDCPVFHEGMSLIERDRAAAYFADQTDGAPMLLCSEIGSEGRNFQFCHHLICWDLPEHPDVLEQRIGRLDRIGQQQTMYIHVGVTDKATEQRLHWYHDILNCIEKTNPAAGAMHDKWYAQYDASPAVGAQVQEEITALLSQLQNGRDRLLEMNSCRQPEANQLVDKVVNFEHEHNPLALLTSATDLLNIHMEPLDDTRYSMIPSDQMLVPLVPGIPNDGCEVTFDRQTATSREDVQFVTWDHPLMQGMTELVTTSELGSATVALLPNKKLKPGTLFFEAIFSVTIKSAYAKIASGFLSESLVRIVVAKNNPNNLDAILPQATLAKVIENAAKNIRKAVVKDYQQDIQILSDTAQAMAQQALDDVVAQTLNDIKQRREFELTRLRELQQRNPLITQADVEQQAIYFDNVEHAVTQQCSIEMNAVRLLVTYQPEKA